MRTDIKGLYRLTGIDIPKAALLLSNVFRDDPFSLCLIPDKKERETYLAVLLEFLVSYGFRYGEMFSTSAEIKDVSIWYHDTKIKTNVFKAIRSGYLIFARKVTKEIRKRFEFFVDVMGGEHNSIIQTEHWYLNFLAVDPRFQGKGIGSKHLSLMLEHVDEMGLSCYLETFTERNALWYRKIDFTIAKEFDVLGRHVWAMLRG